MYDYGNRIAAQLNIKIRHTVVRRPSKPYLHYIISFYAEAIRNLDPDQRKKYHKTILRNYTYDTNAIDGSQLLEAEVNALLTYEVVEKPTK